MSTITKPKTWVDEENVTYTDINNNFDVLYNDHNGGITNANVSSSAAITESKVSFSSSGHGHTGGSDGKRITVNRAFVWYVGGTLSTGTNYGPRYVAPQALTIVKAWLIVRTAPTGASIIVDISKNGSTIWSTQGNRASISASATAGNTTTFNTTPLAAGDYLDLDIDQVGSSVTGADLTVVLETTQP